MCGFSVILGCQGLCILQESWNPFNVSFERECDHFGVSAAVLNVRHRTVFSQMRPGVLVSRVTFSVFPVTELRT